jgi:hypothetical protein
MENRRVGVPFLDPCLRRRTWPLLYWGQTSAAHLLRLETENLKGFRKLGEQWTELPLKTSQLRVRKERSQT